MKKNIDVLEHISKYCEQIEETKDRFGRKFVDFENDRDIKNSICKFFINPTGHYLSGLPGFFIFCFSILPPTLPLIGFLIEIHRLVYAIYMHS